MTEPQRPESELSSEPVSSIPAPVELDWDVSSEREPGALNVLTIDELEWRFRWIPSGEFLMGSAETEAGRKADETRHKVVLTRGYWLMETPVSAQMWESIMDRNPCGFEDPNNPARWVVWNECQDLIDELNGSHKAPEGFRFRFPSEAQWEYAARACQDALYSGSDDIDAVAWHSANAEHKTHPVGQKKANAWGLRDMSGNVLELCWDWYAPYPDAETTVDPYGPESGLYRVARGGYWDSEPEECRVAARNVGPANRGSRLGVRLALVAVER